VISFCLLVRIFVGGRTWDARTVRDRAIKGTKSMRRAPDM
jgi:hypothetical protein